MFLSTHRSLDADWLWGLETQSEEILLFPTPISTVVLRNVKCATCVKKKRKTVKCSRDTSPGHFPFHWYSGCRGVGPPNVKLASWVGCPVRRHKANTLFHVWDGDALSLGELGFLRKIKHIGHDGLQRCYSRSGSGVRVRVRVRQC